LVENAFRLIFAMPGYPVTPTPNENGTALMQFADVPEALTPGADAQDALRPLNFLLVSAVATKARNSGTLNMPSNFPGRGRNRKEQAMTKTSTLNLPPGFSRWDSAEILKTEEDFRNYLEAAFDEDPGDGSLIRTALGVIARARGMTELSRKTGLAREGLYRALSEGGNPEFSTVVKVCAALGVKLATTPFKRRKCLLQSLRKGRKPPSSVSLV
jgi:probable addiction module antidote protein